MTQSEGRVRGQVIGTSSAMMKGGRDTHSTMPDGSLIQVLVVPIYLAGEVLV